MATSKDENQDTLDIGSELDANTPPEIVDHLDADLSKAKDAVAEAMAEFVAAGSDMVPMLKAAELVKAANATVARIERDIAARDYEKRNDERMAKSVALKTAVETLLDTNSVPELIGLGLTGFTVAFNKEDNSFTVNIGASKPVARTVQTSRQVGASTGTINRNLWAYNGGQYTSRQLLSEFGDLESPGFGVAALDRMDNWAEPRWGKDGNTPMKSAPGFDAAVRKLAAKIGATR